MPIFSKYADEDGGGFDGDGFGPGWPDSGWYRKFINKLGEGGYGFGGSGVIPRARDTGAGPFAGGDIVPARSDGTGAPPPAPAGITGTPVAWQYGGPQTTRRTAQFGPALRSLGAGGPFSPTAFPQ